MHPNDLTPPPVRAGLRKLVTCAHCGGFQTILMTARGEICRQCGLPWVSLRDKERRVKRQEAKK